MGLIWKGSEVAEAIRAKAAAAMTEFTGRVETAAKGELYPGHGKRTGTLQRAIQAGSVQSDKSRVKGSVGVKGVRYALKIHRLYQYIVKGFENEQSGFDSILKRHMKG
jgi:hypothetical protein